MDIFVRGCLYVDIFVRGCLYVDVCMWMFVCECLYVCGCLYVDVCMGMYVIVSLSWLHISRILVFVSIFSACTCGVLKVTSCYCFPVCSESLTRIQCSSNPSSNGKALMAAG